MPLTTDDLARLSAVRTIDLTTYGRRSGTPARIEIWWFRFEDRFVITGTPGTRDWLANIRADGRVIVHADGIDYPGLAREVHDSEFRARFFDESAVEVRWYRDMADRRALIDLAPMIVIDLD